MEGKSTVTLHPPAGDGGNEAPQTDFTSASGRGSHWPCPRGWLRRAPPPSGRVGRSALGPPPSKAALRDPRFVWAPPPTPPGASRAPNGTGSGEGKVAVAPPYRPPPRRDMPRALCCFRVPPRQLCDSPKPRGQARGGTYAGERRGCGGAARRLGCIRGEQTKGEL